MISFLNFKSFVVYFVSVSFLMTSLGCSYKPSYLQRGEGAQVSDRWRVRKIDPSKLSPDESAVLEKMGSPQYIRFYRTLDDDRERVYAWVYTAPVRLISFVNRKQVGYVVIDEDPSSLNEQQKNWFFWSSVTAATIGGLALLYYFIVKK